MNNYHHFVISFCNIFLLQRYPVHLVNHQQTVYQTVQPNHPGHRFTKHRQWNLVQIFVISILFEFIILFENILVSSFLQIPFKAITKDFVQTRFVLLVIQLVCNFSVYKIAVLHYLNEVFHVDEFTIFD